MSPTIYIMRNADGDALYVGCSSRPSLRIADHQAGQDWWREVATIEVRHFVDHRSAHDAEWDLIQNLRPRHNVQGTERHSRATREAQARRWARRDADHDAGVVCSYQACLHCRPTRLARGLYVPGHTSGLAALYRERDLRASGEWQPVPLVDQVPVAS